MTQELTIRTAGSNDFPSLADLRIQAERWLHAAGVHQWLDHQRGLRSIRTGIEAGTAWIVEDGTDTAATLTLSGPDWDFWTENDDPYNAIYLYKFIVSDQWRGTGLGDALLDWACETAQSQGKCFLRLDCWRENTALQAYYIDRGFHPVRTMVVEGRDSGALLERPAATRTSGASVPTVRSAYSLA